MVDQKGCRGSCHLRPRPSDTLAAGTTHQRSRRRTSTSHCCKDRGPSSPRGRNAASNRPPSDPGSTRTRRWRGRRRHPSSRWGSCALHNRARCTPRHRSRCGWTSRRRADGSHSSKERRRTFHVCGSSMYDASASSKRGAENFCRKRSWVCPLCFTPCPRPPWPAATSAIVAQAMGTTAVLTEASLARHT